MTDQPTFEYRDEDGDDLIARPMRGIPAVLILTGTNGIAVDLDRVEEVIAGIRDTARTADELRAAAETLRQHASIGAYTATPAGAALLRAREPLAQWLDDWARPGTTEDAPWPDLHRALAVARAINGSQP